MYKAYIVILCSLMVILTACKKDKGVADLANGSVSFQYAAGKDTLQRPLNVLIDSAVVINVNAVLSGSASSTDHWVNFAVDTTKLATYTAKYGAATLLPSSSYFIYKGLTRLPAGASVSDAAQINIVSETKLNGYTTYVLPVVIQSVDNITEGPATTRVIYYVFKTGKPLILSKSLWTIFSYSSVYSTFVPANILDANNTTTYWTSNITLQMPQYIAINFNQVISFTGVTYYLPTALSYPTLGGYPTSIQIETSMDGVTWVNNGIYAGNIVANTQTLNTGLLTGKYMRFTCLASVKYSSTYSAVFIAGISLVP